MNGYKQNKAQYNGNAPNPFAGHACPLCGHEGTSGPLGALGKSYGGMPYGGLEVNIYNINLPKEAYAAQLEGLGKVLGYDTKGGKLGYTPSKRASEYGSKGAKYN